MFLRHKAGDLYEIEDNRETAAADIETLEYAIFSVKTSAENKYNHECWNALYTALEAIAEENKNLIDCNLPH